LGWVKDNTGDYSYMYSSKTFHRERRRKETWTADYTRIVFSLGFPHPVSKLYFPLVHRAIALHDQESLHVELVFLKDVFIQNGYNNRQIHRVLNRQPNISQPEDNLDSVAFLRYVRTIFNRISRVLSWHIKSMGMPPKKVSSFLWPVKDELGLRTLGVYRIPCECGKVYIGQTGRSMDTRLKEHQRHTHPEHPDKSAIAEHSRLGTPHSISQNLHTHH
jgi:hypothetical protein